MLNTKHNSLLTPTQKKSVHLVIDKITLLNVIGKQVFFRQYQPGEKDHIYQFTNMDFIKILRKKTV